MAAATTTKLCTKCRASPAKLKLPPSLLLCGSCAGKALDHKCRLGLELARGAALKGRIDAGKLKEGATGEAETSKAASQREARITDLTEGGAVALGFSGGPSSRALLHLARSYLLPNASTFAGRPTDVTRLLVMYIDDSALFPNSSSQMEEARGLVEAEQGADYGVEFVPLRLEDVFEGEGAQDCSVCDLRWQGETPNLATTVRQMPKVEALRALMYLSQLPGPSRSTAAARRTVIEDLHSNLIQGLLRREARRRGCRALLLGDSGTRMASNLIDGLAKGRGFGLPVQDGFAYWHDDLLVLRPLREALAKEIAYFNKMTGLDSLTPIDPVARLVLKVGEPSQAARDKASMSRLTEAFVRLLEKGVPSTVSTINRTGAKLTFGSHLDGPGSAQVVGPSVPLRAINRATTGSEKDRPAGIGGSGLRLLQSVEALPRWDGRDACAFCGAPALPKSSAQRQDSESLEVSRQVVDLAEALCYACMRTFEAPHAPGVEGVPLPPWVLDGVRRRMGQSYEGGGGDSSRDQPSDVTGHDAEDGLHETADGGRREAMARGGQDVRPVAREEMRQSLGSFLLDE